MEVLIGEQRLGAARLDEFEVLQLFVDLFVELLNLPFYLRKLVVERLRRLRGLLRGDLRGFGLLLLVGS